MKGRFFLNRTDQTPVEEGMRSELKLGHVQEMGELYELELENIAEGIAWISSTKKNHLDYLTWLELHKKMLGKIWRFAGSIRNTELANPEFKMPYDVRPSLLELEKDLAFWLENHSFSPEETLAIFHERLLTIHPFRDGNGRWARILVEFVADRELLKAPTWGITISDDDLRRKTYIDAVKEARLHKNYHKLIEFMFC